MPRLSAFIQRPLGRVIAVGLLMVVSLVYVVTANHILYNSVLAPTNAITDHQENESVAAVDQYWTTANMNSASDADLQLDNSSDFAQGSSDVSAGKAAQKDGQAPSDGNVAYPLSTIGKIFFSDQSGHNYVCSGTAIVSDNHNTVDTAGHCLYGHGGWMQDVLFCPLYDSGSTPYGAGPNGCWVAKSLAVPADWINARPNDLHHDFGMIVVYPHAQGNLTDIVGGAGWADNQPVKQPFFAYGYPAGYPFDGQTRKSCENASPTRWPNHAGGVVVSIPCNMTGGSSGGGWFIKNGNSWYLNGHNDFTSTLKRGHMFSPYYDNTWDALYKNAQNS